MTREEFDTLRDRMYQDICFINEKKGKDYAGSEDALKNFKEVAKRTGLTPKEAWLVYFTKHMMAIETFIRNGQVESEPIEERIKDAILYLFLLHGLIEDEKTNNQNS